MISPPSEPRSGRSLDNDEVRQSTRVDSSTHVDVILLELVDIIMRTWVTLAVLLGTCSAVDRSKFRKCEHTGFCKRHRSRAAEPVTWSLGSSSLDGAVLVGALVATAPAGTPAPPALRLEASFYTALAYPGGGRPKAMARVRIVEDPAHHREARWETTDVLIGGVQKSGDGSRACAKLDVVDSALSVEVRCADSGSAASPTVLITKNPFKIALVDDVAGARATLVEANARSLFYFEQRSEDPTEAAAAADGAADDAAAAAAAAATAAKKTIVDYNEHGHAIYEDGTTSKDEADAAASADAAAPAVADAAAVAATPSPEVEGWGPESFGGHSDSRPRGPMSVGMDIDFPNAAALYGIPEHATSMALKRTDADSGGAGGYADPYRLYNLDVFEYELDEPMSLYGAIPLLVGHGVVGGSGVTSAAFWLNPSETFIDIAPGGSGGGAGQTSRWVSESGVVDLWLLAGPSSADVWRQVRCSFLLFAAFLVHVGCSLFFRFFPSFSLNCRPRTPVLLPDWYDASAAPLQPCVPPVSVELQGRGGRIRGGGQV